jgi:ATP-binding cassette subfamily B protein
MAVYWSLSDFLCFTQITLVLIVGAYRVDAGLMTAGTLVSFMSYVTLYLFPIRQMGRIVTEMGKSSVAIGRITEVLNAEAELVKTGFVTHAPDFNPTGRITFDSVSFIHKSTRVLDKISFEVSAGSTLALLGPSGSGKSTIAQLLMRFYEVDTGHIRIDGIDIKTLDRKVVRRQIGAVMQEPFLFSKSLRDNIKLARRNAPDEHMLEAAAMAGISESIERFEQKYDTLVGERGVTLSGGQRQRVAIARALLKDAPILILDDALSAVDTHTESLILDALRRRGGRQTTLVIAHRLSTLMHADQIIVLDHGRIVQRGTHASLVEIDGMYRRLWQIQSALETDLQGEPDLKPETGRPADRFVSA